MNKIKSALVILICFLMVVLSVPNVFANDVLLLGDTDSDGYVSIRDATTIQRHLAKFITLSDEKLKVADTNCDGNVDITDVTTIQKFLADFEMDFPINQPIEEKGSNILVVYFSRTGEQYNVGVIDKGNTAIVADMIIEQTGADSYEILPADDHYPMTYKELTEVAQKEQQENARPEIKNNTPDLSKYDTIFIGSPVWWGDYPMIMYTFLEGNDLNGKTIIPFSTHAGSGLCSFDRILSNLYPDSEVKTGLAVVGADTQNNPDTVRTNVSNWLKGLGY